MFLDSPEFFTSNFSACIRGFTFTKSERIQQLSSCEPLHVYIHKNFEY